MKILACWATLLVCVLLTGCGGGGSHSSSPGASAVAMRDVIRAGDKITIRLTGVPDQGYFTEVQVPPSGDITVSYLSQNFHAVGLTPDELGNQLTEAYKSQRIYTSPVVTVLPEDRFVVVGGDVRAPSNVVWRSDSTVMSTINACGGFTEYANRHSVTILRGQQKIVVDCVKAISNPGSDPAVVPGDQIYVPRTPF